MKGRPSGPEGEVKDAVDSAADEDEGRCKPGLADAPRLWAGERTLSALSTTTGYDRISSTATAGLAASMFKPKSLAMVEFGSTVARRGASCSRSCCRASHARAERLHPAVLGGGGTAEA